ncbi:electron transfer flavoprotein subunit alpha/FixB family protein [Pseudomonas sp. ZM23]|uniref:Electron transfer flavoprotein subunit alpha/FixB family protein n=1 Tax=Pseudomonas triclosanedens TaxID=2961893 RepID=A0ABY7A3E9_9PSED|nr:electron transfer flavoprotein subunit alpha/FixB family protein [Pseudomonas triclosanedens]MCP8465068.1 electron transfer flavoprotein subunit alpha/FixB family protein [Pseudomonas triclosanedens]MCP8470220.1 electron transfer flavoprotein subunit alpha/FixB family protein [Pseudomonas triclosanedens]MCP8476025.1 electron transfer flavoprotein subunit alpha/FixB family protein [Pseudomonas triclosanedens]WAI51737.1 electron transfer flavoprotein subunit alpha/FixB family protein [Pseudomo
MSEAVALGQALAAMAEASVVGGLLGQDVGESAERLAQYALARVVVIDDPRLGDCTCEPLVVAAAKIVEATAPDVVLVPHNSSSAEWAVRLAARLGAGLLSNCSAIVFAQGEVSATRAVCGGAVQAQWSLQAPLKVLTLAPGAHAEPAQAGQAAIETLALGPLDNPVELLEVIAEATGAGPSLRTARVVVSGGIGIGSAENWSTIEDTAKSIGGAVGATRAAVEMGWAPSSMQVGFSGLKVNAEVYIAAGISGAIHHLAGIARVRNVIAINSDPEANIFSVSRYGVVGDANEVLPAFSARLNELKSK